MPSDLGISTALGLRGDNPDRLPLIDINPDHVQRDTIRGNISAASGAFDLAAMSNQFSSEQMLAMLERMLPGYGGLQAQNSANIASQLRGEIPDDVRRLLEIRSAEGGVASGTGGSQFNLGNLLGSYGRTSYDIMQQGQDSLAKWTASSPKSQQFDFTSMFFSPQQRLGFEFGQATANLQIQEFNNWVDTLPSNFERGLGTFLDYNTNVITGFGEKMLGGVGGMAAVGMAGAQPGQDTGAGQGGGGGL